jgi:hypothetical protein
MRKALAIVILSLVAGLYGGSIAVEHYRQAAAMAAERAA